MKSKAKLKLSALVAAIAIMALLLAGCGADDNGGSGVNGGNDSGGASSGTPGVTPDLDGDGLIDDGGIDSGDVLGGNGGNGNSGSNGSNGGSAGGAGGATGGSGSTGSGGIGGSAAGRTGGTNAYTNGGAVDGTPDGASTFGATDDTNIDDSYR